MAKEKHDLIPVIVLRVDTACCKECPRNLRKALLKMDGVCEVAFDSEYKNICIRSTLDPLLIIKEIAKMNKNAELIFYDKEPVLEDHPRKNPKSTPREKHPRTETNGEEKSTRRSPDHHHDARKKKNEDGQDNVDRGSNGKKSSCHCPDHHEADDDRYYTRNVRCDDGPEKHCHSRHDHHQDSPDNNRGNGREKYYRCRNYDSGPEKQYYRCRNYDPPSKEDEKIPKMFFDDADIFKDYYNNINGRRRSTAFWDRYMPTRDEGPMFRNHKDHDDHGHFRSKSCRYDARNSKQQWCGPEANPYENVYNSTMPSLYEHHHQHSSMPPPFEQYGSRMPPPPPRPPTSPYYSDFSVENPYGCIIM